MDLGFISMISLSLSWDAQNLQWSSPPQLAGGCGLFIGGDPNGEMSEGTRCDSLTRVHNGRNFNAQLFLRNKKADSPNEFSLGGTKCDDFSFELSFISVRFLSVGKLS